MLFCREGAHSNARFAALNGRDFRLWSACRGSVYTAAPRPGTARYTSRYLLPLVNMATGEAPCYTVVFDDSSETPSTQDLRSALQKGTDEAKFDTLRKIIVSTINGNPQVLRCERNMSKSSADTAVLAAAPYARHPICYAVTE